MISFDFTHDEYSFCFNPHNYAPLVSELVKDLSFRNMYTIFNSDCYSCHQKFPVKKKKKKKSV